MKKIITIVLGVVVLLITIFGIRFVSGPEDLWICQNGEWIKHGNPDSERPLGGCEGELNNTANFDEIGHLTKDNPGLKDGVWYLVYEKPGKPALTIELFFDDKSQCKFNGDLGKCPDVLLPSSALTKIRGVLDKDVVKVISAESGNN